MQIYDAANLNIGLPRVVTPRAEAIWPHQWPLNADPAYRAACPPDALISAAWSEIPDHDTVAYCYLDDSQQLPPAEKAKFCQRFQSITGKPCGVYGTGGNGGNLRNIMSASSWHWNAGSIAANRDFATTAVYRIDDDAARLPAIDYAGALFPSAYCKGDIGLYTPLSDCVQAWQLYLEHVLSMAYRFAGGKPVLPFVWVKPGAYTAADESRLCAAIIQSFVDRDHDFIVWGASPTDPLSVAVKQVSGR